MIRRIQRQIYDQVFDDVWDKMRDRIWKKTVTQIYYCMGIQVKRHVDIKIHNRELNQIRTKIEDQANENT
jgi:hypothetical protein